MMAKTLIILMILHDSSYLIYANMILFVIYALLVNNLKNLKNINIYTRFIKNQKY